MNELENLLIQKSQDGDVESFEKLIKQYQKRAFNISYRMLGNVEDAKDVTQDSFIKIYKSIRKFKGQSSFSTWLYKVVTNTCLDFIRKRDKHKVYSYDQPSETEDGEIIREFADLKNNTEEIVERKLLKDTVNKAINLLSENHKTMIVLRDIRGFSYDQIAQILTCSQGTVKSRMNRARHVLKNLLEEKMELSKRDCV